MTTKETSYLEQHTAMKTLGDVTAASAMVGAVFQWLPAIAALFTIIWTGTRLYEAFTGKNFSESWIAKAFTGRS